jgi:hypothetical protein
MQHPVRRAWYAVRYGRHEADLAEEMAFHREMTRREIEEGGLESTDAAFATPGVRKRPAREGSSARRLDLAVGAGSLAGRFAFRLTTIELREITQDESVAIRQSPTRTRPLRHS